MIDKEEEELISIILRKRPDLTREKLENIIIEKMRHKSVSRKTALYLISIDYGVRLDSPVEDYIKISQLADGLTNIRLIGRILWLKETEKLKSREGIYTRGAIIDETGLTSIIFWDRSKEELESDGIVEGSIVEIINGYVRIGLTNRPEVHLTRRGRIRLSKEEFYNIPNLEDILKQVQDINIGDDYVNTYGLVVSLDNVREVTVNDKSVKLSSFTLGFGDRTIQVVLWRKAVDEYSWIKEGDKIVILNGRIKFNRFNEIEIHISRFSHIKLHPGLEIKIKTTYKTISDVSPGYNLSKLYVRVLAKGKKRFNRKIGKDSISLYVIDNTGEASLTIIGEKARIGDIVRIQDILSIERFRASIKGGITYIFADDTAQIEINPHEVPNILPVYTIPFKASSSITTVDKIVNVEGKIVEFLKEDSYDFITDFTPPSSILIEDYEGNPIKVLFRGGLDDFTDEKLEENDHIRIIGALVDISSLFNASRIPVIKLRAFTRIEKLRK